MNLGDIVLYQMPVKDGEKTSEVFPAIIYQIHEHSVAGLHVLTNDPGTTRLARVAYSKELKPEHWSFRNAT